MWRKFSTGEFRIAELTRLRHKIALVVAFLYIAAVAAGARDGSKDWIVLNNCRLIVNPANDGDSFHASAGAKEYIFRLYFVDAPETDEMTPARLVEQAKYFGISVPQAIEVGRAAKEFTRVKLSEPFTVFTHLSDAMGRSKIERFYGFVKTKEGDLGEQLVRNGLARIYGYKAVPPGLRNSRAELERFLQLENQARQEKLGAWGIINAGQRNVPPETNRPRETPEASSGIPSSTPKPNRSHPREKTPFGKIDINTATEKELKTIPGIGPVMAARVIAARPFRSADDLRRVSGIGDKKYTLIRPYFQ